MFLRPHDFQLNRPGKSRSRTLPNEVYSVVGPPRTEESAVSLQIYKRFADGGVLGLELFLISQHIEHPGF
jgi:hypothetical protein